MSPSFIYKVSKFDEELGVLQNVVSDFGYPHQINTAGTSITIVLNNSFDDIGLALTEVDLTEETGVSITDETGTSVIVRRDYTYGGIPVQEGNDIYVYRVDDYNPSGVQVYHGYIETVDVDEDAGQITLTVPTYGSQLDNYMIDLSGATNITQDVYDSEWTFGGKNSPANDAIAQTFQATGDTTIDTIYVRMKAMTANYKRCRLELYSGTPTTPGALLGSTNRKITSTTIQYWSFALPAPVMITGLTNYFFKLINDNSSPTYSTNPFGAEYNSTTVYASGNMYTYNGSSWTSQTYDLSFQTSGGSNSTLEVTYFGEDPAVIFTNNLDIAANKGAVVTYDPSDIDSTGVSVAARFSSNTVLEGLDKAKSLAPAGYYWTVDPADDTASFKTLGSTADHTFYRGAGLSNFTSGSSIKDVRSAAFLTGGDDGSGSNILAYGENPSVITKYRSGYRLERLTDNRVLSVAEAQIIIDGFLGDRSSAIYRAECFIPCTKYDITTIKVGQMVSIIGYGSLINSILFMVLGIEPSLAGIQLTLADSPVLPSNAVQKLQRRLLNTETLNNPSSAN